jgi:hypothetical protein
MHGMVGDDEASTSRSRSSVQLGEVATVAGGATLWAERSVISIRHYTSASMAGLASLNKGYYPWLWMQLILYY